MAVATKEASLLGRLRDPEDRDAWTQFVDLFAPVVFCWCRTLGLDGKEAGELVREVFADLSIELAVNRKKRISSVKSWLRNALVEKYQQHSRATHSHSSAMIELGQDGSSSRWGAEYQNVLLNRMLNQLAGELRPGTWTAFWRHVILNRPASEVAKELGATTAAVYVARARVLRMLRARARELWS